MRGMVIRKRLVFSRIAQLPPDERERAQKLYSVLDKIEWLCLAPIYTAAVFIILWMLIAVMLFTSSSSDYSGDGKNIRLFVILLVGILICAFGTFIANKLIFRVCRDKELNKLQAMVSSDHTCIDALETIKELDPDMGHNIGWYIAQAIYK
jgi:hypothetical protein